MRRNRREEATQELTSHKKVGNNNMMDVIHSKNDALNMTTFGKMRQMKTGLGVDRVD
jgi:hypothetical protein